jgi:hypothetical protein
VEFRYQGYPAGQQGSFAATIYVSALSNKGETIFELALLILFSDGAFTLPHDDALSIDTADAKPAETASIAATNRIINTLLIVSSFDFTPYCQDPTTESLDCFFFQGVLGTKLVPRKSATSTVPLYD